MIDAKADVAELRIAGRRIKVLKETLPRAMVPALNRVGQQVKTRASRKVRETYDIKAKEINQRVTLRRSTKDSMITDLRWRGGNLPIIKFRTNPNKPRDPMKPPPKVLRASVKRSGMKPVPGAFVTKVGRGEHLGVFKRAGRRRLPIREVMGPAVPVMVNNPEIIDDLETFARDTLDRRLDHEMTRQLKKEGFE
ncbi:phage tail protein [Paenibacillus xanthanilyticus]|uniref:Phage tail protein n=1 Tax=Paenibacillus xanthanilyticus TaxID=1783531 RepID=A0ABV8KA77_9BACL